MTTPSSSSAAPPLTPSTRLLLYVQSALLPTTISSPPQNQSDLTAILPSLLSSYQASLKSSLPNVASSQEEGGEEAEDADAPIMDPLTGMSSQPEWKKFSLAQNLMNEINLDLPRLYITGISPSFFQDTTLPAGSLPLLGSEARKRLDGIGNCLYLFCMDVDCDVGYRQGMHEICGIIYHMVSLGLDNSKAADEEMNFDRTEALTSLIFTYIMKDNLITVYDPNVTPPPSNPYPSLKVTHSNLININAVNSKSKPKQTTKAIILSAQIEHSIKHITPTVYEAVRGFSIPPQIWMLKVLRILGSRELGCREGGWLEVFDFIVCGFNSDFRDEGYRDGDGDGEGSYQKMIIQSGFFIRLQSLVITMLLSIAPLLLTKKLDENDLLLLLLRYEFPTATLGYNSKYFTDVMGIVERKVRELYSTYPRPLEGGNQGGRGDLKDVWEKNTPRSLSLASSSMSVAEEREAPRQDSKGSNANNANNANNSNDFFNQAMSLVSSVSGNWVTSSTRQHQPLDSKLEAFDEPTNTLVKKNVMVKTRDSDIVNSNSDSDSNVTKSSKPTVKTKVKAAADVALMNDLFGAAKAKAVNRNVFDDSHSGSDSESDCDGEDGSQPIANSNSHQGLFVSSAFANDVPASVMSTGVGVSDFGSKQILTEYRSGYEGRDKDDIDSESQSQEVLLSSSSSSSTSTDICDLNEGDDDDGNDKGKCKEAVGVIKSYLLIEHGDAVPKRIKDALELLERKSWSE